VTTLIGMEKGEEVLEVDRGFEQFPTGRRASGSHKRLTRFDNKRLVLMLDHT